MRSKFIVGLTGQSGAGKSTAARFFEEYGLKTISADEIVAQLYSYDSPCRKTVAACFGNDIVKDGLLDRALLAKRAFSSRESTALLSSLVHPFVTAQFCKMAKEYFASGKSVVIYDAPQLFESDFDAACGFIISVVSKRKARIARICRRDNISEALALQRINAQLSEDFFRKNSDAVIENNKGTKELSLACQTLAEQLKQR